MNSVQNYAFYFLYSLIIGVSVSFDICCMDRQIDDNFFDLTHAERWTDGTLLHHNLAHFTPRDGEYTISSPCNTKDEFTKKFAHIHRLAELGACTYATEDKKSQIVAGFANGSCAVCWKNEEVKGEYWVETDILKNDTGTENPVLACALTDSEKAPFSRLGKMALLIGYNNKLMVLNRENRDWYTLKITHPITHIIKGHTENSWVMAGGDSFSVMHLSEGESRLLHFRYSTTQFTDDYVKKPITGVGLYKSGVVVQRGSSVDVVLPLLETDALKKKLAENG